jgi:hypothetical protein
VGLSAGLKFDVAGEETPMLEKCSARPIVPAAAKYLTGKKRHCKTLAEVAIR